MTAKLSASADGTKVTIGTAAEDALQIDATAKTIAALAPYQMNGNGPAFSAVANAVQTLTTSVAAKVLLQTENFDTNNNFANSTFTPTVAGYYQINGQVDFNTGNTAAANFVYIYKNGAANLSTRGISNTTLAQSVFIGGVFYMNGTTDTLELWAMQATGANQATIAAGTWMSAALVRAA